MPVQLFHGDNLLELGEAVRVLRDRFHPADVLTFEGSDVTLSKLSEACLTAGLFDPDRLVIVRDLHERIKGARKESPELEELTRIMGSVAPTTTLLLISPGLSPDHPFFVAVRSIGGAVKSFAVPRKGDLPRWLEGRAAAIGATLDRDAADLLIELIGADTVLLSNELEKLTLYAGEERITPTTVDALVGSVTQESIFALVDAIAAGNEALAFRLLHAQLERSTSTPTDVALYLIRMLARQVRILLRIRLGQEEGRSTGQLTAELKLPRYYADRYFRQARRLSRERLIATFDQLAALEHGLKSGRADPTTGLDLLVADLSA